MFNKNIGIGFQNAALHLCQRALVPLLQNNRGLYLGQGKIVKALLITLRGYDMVDGRHIFGVAFPILRGWQLCIHHSDSEWFFSTDRISVTRITTAQMAQIKLIWDLSAKT